MNFSFVHSPADIAALHREVHRHRRDDLAVECGWESLAQIQHDILRLCAAAHVPCIWATQVLDELARYGLLIRAEITDAAMGA